MAILKIRHCSNLWFNVTPLLQNVELRTPLVVLIVELTSAGQCQDMTRRVVRLSVALGKMSFLTDTDMFTYYIVCRWASHSPDRALSCFTWKLHLAPASKLPCLLKHNVLSPQGIVVLVFYSGWFFKRFVYHLFYLGWVMVQMSVSARQTFWKQVFRFKFQFNERS